MNKEITFSPLKGSVNSIGSKSLSHRYLIISFINNKKLTINNFNLCDDTKITLNILKKLGAKFKVKDDQVIFLKRKIKNDKYIKINIKNSASSLRMLLPLINSLKEEILLTGSKKIFSRPLDEYLSILNKENIEYSLNKTSLLIKGKLENKDYEIMANKTSQFLSGFIFLNAFYKSQNIVKVISKEIASRPYFLLTIKSLKKFGYDFEIKNREIKLKTYSEKNIKSVQIPSDFSLLAPFFILKKYYDIKINCNNIKPFVPERKILDIIKNNPNKINISHMIDLGPVLFINALFNEKETIIKGIKNLSYKESDRLFGLLKELDKIKAEYILKNKNEIIIKGKKHYEGNFIFNSLNDHRLVMAFTLFAFLNKSNVIIKKADSISKSFNNFFDIISSLK